MLIVKHCVRFAGKRTVQFHNFYHLKFPLGPPKQGSHLLLMVVKTQNWSGSFHIVLEINMK